MLVNILVSVKDVMDHVATAQKIKLQIKINVMDAI